METGRGARAWGICKDACDGVMYPEILSDHRQRRNDRMVIIISLLVLKDWCLKSVRLNKARQIIRETQVAEETETLRRINSII